MPDINDTMNTEINEETTTNENTTEGLTPHQVIDNAKRSFIAEVYNSVDYSALFKMVGQPEKYEEFSKYVQEYDENKTTEKPRLWHSFLDDVPASILVIADMYDQMIAGSINISLSASNLLTSVVYDTVIASQLHTVQLHHEDFAGAIGELQREVEKLKKCVYNTEKCDDSRSSKDDCCTTRSPEGVNDIE